MSNRMHGSEQPPVERSSSSGEAVLSSDQLVNSYSRPLGTKYGTGVPDRLRVGATPTVCPKSSTLFLRTNQPDKRGINKTPPETGNPTVGTSSGGRVLVQHIPGPQEGWRAETSDKSQSPQPVCQHRAFQNGGYSHCEGSIETRGLASQSRPEGRILCHPHRSDSQKVPQMSSSGENISVYVSTFRAVIGPVGIHQDTKTSTGPSLRDGHASGSLYRRHSDPWQSKETALDHTEGIVYLLESLGFVINKDKSVLIPSQTIEFLGLTIDTINMELLLPPHKIKMIRAESRKLLREGTTSAHALAAYWGK